MLLEREVGNFLWKVPSEVGKFLLKIESFTKIGKLDRFLSRIGCSISIDFSNFGCTFQLRLELSNFILSNFISNLPTSRSFKLPFSTTRIPQELPNLIHVEILTWGNILKFRIGVIWFRLIQRSIFDGWCKLFILSTQIGFDFCFSTIGVTPIPPWCTTPL